MTESVRTITGETLQVAQAPASGATDGITLVAGTAGKTAAALTRGLYMVSVPSGFTVQFCRGVFATTAAAATDFPLDAGTYYFGVADGDTLSFYHATLTPTISVAKV